MSLFPQREMTGKWWRDHSLSLILTALLVAQTALAIYDGAIVFELEQPLGPDVRVWSADFWTWWRWSYNVSLVADTFGVLLVVLLTKWTFERGSAESN